jgi:hypothetical protein
MFIPEIKWKKEDNDREECVKIAKTLARSLHETFGGDVDMMTKEVDDILNVSFLLNRTYQMISSYCDEYHTKIVLGTQCFLVIMAQLSDLKSVPMEALPCLADSIFHSMAFYPIMPEIKTMATGVFRNEDLERGNGHGEF